MSGIKNKKILIAAAAVIAAVLLLVLLLGSGSQKLHETADITVWYADDNLMAEKLEDYVRNFNESNGTELNVSVSARGFSSESSLVDSVRNAVKNDGSLPDVIIGSADISAYLQSKDKLTDLTMYLKQHDINGCDDGMLEACTYKDRILSLPLAAEADVLIINRGLYSEIPESFEALCDAANRYYSENKEYFFTVSNYSSFFNSAMAQLGEQFNAENPFEYENDNVRHIYDQLATAAFKRGYTAVRENPAEIVARGELACAIVSASQIMEAADNLDMSKIELMPCPCMESGEAVYVPRVISACILKSDSNTETGAALFLDWLASDKDNTGFALGSGLIPARGSIPHSNSQVYNALMKTVNAMDFRFYAANANYALKSIDFNSIIDTIMKKSLS